MAISTNGLLTNNFTAPVVGHASWDSTGYLDYTGSFVPSTTNSSIVVVYIHAEQATNNNILSSYLRAWFGSTELSLSQLTGQNYVSGPLGGIKTFYAYLNLPANGSQTFTLRLTNEFVCGGGYFCYQVAAYKGTSGVAAKNAHAGGYAYTYKQPFTYITNTSTSTMPLLTVITSNNADNATTPSASTGQSRFAINTAYPIYKVDFALDYFSPPSSTNRAWWGYDPGGTIDYIWASANLPLLDGSNRSYPTSTTDNIGIQPKTIGYTRTEMYEAPNNVTLSAKSIVITKSNVVTLANVEVPGNYVLLPALGDNGRKNLFVKKLDIEIDDNYRGDLTIPATLNLDGFNTSSMSVWSDGTISQWRDSVNNINFTQSTTAERPFLTRGDNLENIIKGSESIGDSTYYDYVRSAVVGSGPTPPTGYSTSAEIKEDGTAAQHHYFQLDTNNNLDISIGASYTVSFIAKANTRNRCAIAQGGGGSTYWDYRVDLSNGTSWGSTTGGSTARSIESLGNGWYKISVTFTCSASYRGYGFYIMINDNSGNLTHNGDNTSSIYFTGLQVRRNWTSSDYIATTTYPVYAGFLTNPDNRLENRILFSNDISATQWSTFNTRKFGTNTFYETSTSPSVTERHYVYFNRTEVTNPITISLEARSIGGRRLGVGHQGDICVFDLQNSSIISSFGSTTISAIDDEWNSITIRNFSTTPTNSTLLIYSIHPSGTTWETQQMFVGDSTKGIEIRNVHVRIPSASDTCVETTDTPTYAYKKVPYFPRYGSHLLASTTTNLNFMTSNNSLYIAGKLDCNAVDSEPHYFMDNHFPGTPSGVTLSYAAGDLRLYTYDGSGHYISNSTTENNHPYLFSFIKSGTYGTHHLNSRTVGTPGAIASATASTSFIRLGTTVAKIYGFRGYIPNVVAYSNALNSSEHTVKTNYLRSLLGVDDKKSEIPTKEIETEKSQNLIITFLPKFNVSFGAIADYPGYYQNSDGFLNTTKYLQDSDYYQQFAYELRCGEPLNAYEKMMKKLLHPVGYKMFGEFKEEVIVDNNSTVEIETDTESGGNVLWLDGSDLTTITSWSDGTISEWRDKSGNNFHFTQSVTANRPYLTRNDTLENRIKYSEDITQISAGLWGVVNVTATSPTLMTETAAGAATYYVYQSAETTKGAQYTFSADLKKGTGRDWMYLRVNGTSAGGVFFDIANGVKGTEQSGYTGTITDLGSGVYRCSVSWTAFASESPTFRIYIAVSDGNTTVTGNATYNYNIYQTQVTRVGGGYVTTTSYPQYFGLNNKAVPYFPGAATYMSRSVSASIDFGYIDSSIFSVLKLDGSEEVYAFLESNGGSTTKGIIEDASNGAGKYHNFITYDGSGHAIAGTYQIGQSSVVRCFSKSNTSTSPIGNFYINGAQDGTANQAMTNSTSAIGNNLILGNRSSATSGLRGYLQEVKAYATTSTTNILTESTELMTKWSIS